MEIVRNKNNPTQQSKDSGGASVMSSTLMKRQNLIRFVMEHLSKESGIWVRDIMGKMNRLFAEDDIDQHMKVKYFYENAQIFFEEYVTDLDAASILCTVYICALQVGVVQFGDEVESNPEFYDGVDMYDWHEVDYETLKRFDLTAASSVIGNVYGAGEYDVLACGLFTMQLLDYLS